MKLMRASLLAAAMAFAAADAGAAAAPQLEVSPGLAGIARAGRWMPLHVVLIATDTDIAGEVVATWGDAVVHRAVSIAAPSRTRIDLYLRASDPRDTVHVELQSGSRVLATRDAAVRLAASTDEVTLCLRASDVLPAFAPPCTATIGAEALPPSARGLEAADATVWSGPPASLSAAQRQALGTWRAYRDLLESDVLMEFPHAAPFARQPGTPVGALQLVAVVGAAYVALLATAASLSPVRRRTPVAHTYVAVIVIVAIGTIGAAGAAQSGPAAAVRIRHTTTVQQLENGSSQVIMRGAIQFPAFDRYRVSADLDDGAMTLDQYPFHASWFDAAGRPVVTGTFALGSSAPFDLEAPIPFAPIAMSWDESGVRVTNTSSTPLRACAFSGGFAGRSRADILPGATLVAPVTGSPGDTPLLSCTLSELPFAFRESRRDVETTGSILLNAYLRAAATAARERTR